VQVERFWVSHFNGYTLLYYFKILFIYTSIVIEYKYFTPKRYLLTHGTTCPTYINQGLGMACYFMRAAIWEVVPPSLIIWYAMKNKLA